MRITEEYYEKALDFLGDHYHKDEPLHGSSGAMLGEEAREIHMEALSQNISVMIVNEKDGEVMALITNQVFKKGECHGDGKIEDFGLRAVYAFVNYCEKKLNIFEHFNVTEAVNLFSLASNRKYRRKGLGTKVIQASLAMFRNFGVGNICVKTEGSSTFSQKIFENVGMVCLHEEVYTDYKVDGKKVFEDTGIHNSVKIYGMMIKG